MDKEGVVIMPKKLGNTKMPKFNYWQVMTNISPTERKGIKWGL